MPDFPPIYLLRHGQTVWNADGRMQGQLNSDLTDLGRVQAKRQGEILSRLHISSETEVICSPLGRAVETANLVLRGQVWPVRHDPRIMEVGVGDWEGRQRDDVVAENPEIFSGEISVYDRFLMAPNGESEAELQARTADFLTELSKPSIVISHGITISVLRGHLMGLNRDQIAALDHPQGRVIEIKDGVETIH